MRVDAAFKEKEPGELMKIGEVSRLTGVGVEALRFYEKSGLLDQPVRTYSGYRMYGQEVLARIAFIKQAQVLGFALDEIRRLIRHKQEGESPCEEVREIVRARLDELDERISQMTRFRKELTATLSEWEKVGHADGHVCGLIENSHVRPVSGEKRSGLRKKEKKQ